MGHSVLSISYKICILQFNETCKEIDVCYVYVSYDRVSVSYDTIRILR